MLKAILILTLMNTVIALKFYVQDKMRERTEQKGNLRRRLNSIRDMKL